MEKNEKGMGRNFFLLAVLRREEENSLAFSLERKPREFLIGSVNGLFEKGNSVETDVPCEERAVSAKKNHKLIREAEERGLVEVGLNRAKAYEWWSSRSFLGGMLVRILRAVPGLYSIFGPVTEKASHKKVLKSARRSVRVFEELYAVNGVYLIHRTRKKIIENPASWEEFIKRIMPGA